MHSPAGLGLQVAWSSFHATALSGTSFLKFSWFQESPGILITNADFWTLQIILNQIRQENIGIYLINECQDHHYGPGSILGKPCSRNNRAWGGGSGLSYNSCCQHWWQLNNTKTSLFWKPHLCGLTHCVTCLSMSAFEDYLTSMWWLSFHHHQNTFTNHMESHKRHSICFIGQGQLNLKQSVESLLMGVKTMDRCHWI